MSDLKIVALDQHHEADVLALSLRAWRPVFAKLQPAVPPYVYNAFYPDGWDVRQDADIRAFLRTEGRLAWVAVDADTVLGWVGIRLHPEDRMGEIYIMAVDPDRQRERVGTALMDHAMAVMRRARLEIVMVETGDDPGHAPPGRPTNGLRLSADR